MNGSDEAPRGRDEWRVEIALDEEHNGAKLGDALHHLKLDNEARKLLGGSVIVTRDGRFVFIYAWHQESAQEAERVVKNLMQDQKLAGQVQLMHWHPVAEEWKDASEPLPDDEAERAQEMHEAEHEGSEEAHRYGEYPWEVVIGLPHVRDGHALAEKLRGEGLPVKRHFRYLLVGAPSEDKAVEIGERLEGETPEGARIGIRGNPDDMPLPAFVNLSALKPGFLRDLGL